MRLRLKENPREWQKFTAAICMACGVAATLCWRRHVLGQTAYLLVLALPLTVLLTCLVRPRWYRGFYRGGMTVSFTIGQAMGQVLLALLFLFALTPLAIVLRLLGKDPLKIKRDIHAATYWQAARPGDEFDREF
jgi:hypothetical protein